MPRYSIDRTDRVFDWAATVAEPERLEGMYTWLRTVAVDPAMASSGHVEHITHRRRFYFADVHPARTRVTYRVVETPARCVRILRIDDGAYELD